MEAVTPEGRVSDRQEAGVRERWKGRGSWGYKKASLSELSIRKDLEGWTRDLLLGMDGTRAEEREEWDVGGRDLVGCS